MTGIDLILSMVCNVTSCDPNPGPPPTVYIGFPPPVNPESEIKAAREFINGKHLTIGTFNDGPMSGVSVNEDGTIVEWGIALNIMGILSEKFNFTYDIVVPPATIDSRDRERKESWLVRMLMNHKLDMAAAFISITTNWQKLLKFSVETDTINCLIMSAHKPVPQENTLQLLQPFHSNVWYLLLLMIIVFAACLILLTRLRSKIINDGEPPFTLSSSLSYAYRACTNQDLQLSAKSSMTRILLTTWLIFVFLVSAYYGGLLSKGFMVTSVAEKTAIKLDLFKVTESGIALDYRNAKDCYDKLSLNHFIRRPSGFAYPKNTTLNTLFDREIKKLYYSGILQQFYKNALMVINKLCPVVISSGAQQLDLLDLSFAYYCWLVGAAASLLVFVMESILHWVRKQKGVLVARENKTSSGYNNRLAPLHGRAQFATSHRPTSSQFQMTVVNGRQYLVARAKDGEPRRVSGDTLSASLFD